MARLPLSRTLAFVHSCKQIYFNGSDNSFNYNHSACNTENITNDSVLNFPCTVLAVSIGIAKRQLNCFKEMFWVFASLTIIYCGCYSSYSKEHWYGMVFKVYHILKYWKTLSYMNECVIQCLHCIYFGGWPLKYFFNFPFLNGLVWLVPPTMLALFSCHRDAWAAMRTNLHKWSWHFCRLRQSERLGGGGGWKVDWGKERTKIRTIKRVKNSFQVPGRFTNAFLIMYLD